MFKIELLRLYLSALKPIYLFISAGIKIVYLISYLIETAVIEKYLAGPSSKSKVCLIDDLYFYFSCICIALAKPVVKLLLNC